MKFEISLDAIITLSIASLLCLAVYGCTSVYVTREANNPGHVAAETKSVYGK